jgi:hypothetical protein
MFCKSYCQPLMDAAASGESLNRTLATHVAGCEGCSASFAEERALFAAIEDSLGVRSNAPAPPSLVPRVRAQIAASPTKTTWRIPVLAFAMLGLVAGVVAISPAFHWHSTPDDSRGKSPAKASTVQSTASREATGSLVQSAPPVKQFPPRLEKVVLSRPRVRSDVEVQISAEEQAGLEHYSARLRARSLENSARAVGAVESDLAFNIRPLEIAAMDVRQLTIEPLESDEYN